MTENILKIVPSPEELQITTRLSQGSLRCPEMGCNYVAPNTSVLGLHRAQFHNIRTNPGKGSVAHYHCPVANCCFGPKSERYLKNLDILRTHYMKTHSEKKFACQKCGKAFGLERDCHRHEKECGESFACEDCRKTFTNRAALMRHCAYQQHKKPEKAMRVEPVKEKTPPKPKVKKKKMPVVRKIQPFILPKQIPGLQNNLEIQTGPSGSNVLFLSKLTTDSSVSQSVQTMEKLKRSAAIQTNLCQKSQFVSTQNEKLSTGIQTMLPIQGENFCVAQTQTKESILQKAMNAARIPVMKVCKSTQKSSSGGTKRKFPAASVCSAESQTWNSLTAKKRGSLAHPVSYSSFYFQVHHSHGKEVQLENDNFVEQFMSSMSTQTNLSCVVQQNPSQSAGELCNTQLQDCHTQTLIHIDKNATPSQPSKSLDLMNMSHNQITQIISSDQDTQTCSQIARSIYSSNFGLGAIQDNQTQTPASYLNPDVIQSSHTQTQICAMMSKAETQDQGTLCDDLFSNINILPSRNADPKQLSAFSTQTKSARVNNVAQVPVAQSFSSSGVSVSLGSNSGIDFLLEDDEKASSSSTINASKSTETLTNLLMEVINENEKSLKNQASSTSIVSSFSGSHIDTQEEVDNEVSMISMQTQTFGNLGMDSMTQTVEGLDWNSNPQTMEDLFTDMMTQTGDDLLEYLTSDSQTQTLNQFCETLPSFSSTSGQAQEYFNTSDTVSVSTTDISTQINYENLFGDNASTQTAWDMDDQILDFQTGSFSAPTNVFINQIERKIPVETGTFADISEKEKNSMEDFDMYRKSSAFDAICCWQNEGSFETTGTQIDLLDVGPVTETSETQTAFDPLFASSGSGKSDFSVQPIKYLESSHTQTTADPMLPTLAFDDDIHPLLLSRENIFLRKETSETPSSVTQETTKCQTQWDSPLTSVGTSETQTDDADIFAVTCNDIQTQTNLGPQLMADIDLTDSFTQTSIDQNTQTGSMFDMLH